MAIASLIHKQGIPQNETLFEGNASGRQFRMMLVLAGFLLLIRIIGCFTAADLVNTRKVHKDGDRSFSG